MGTIKMRLTLGIIYIMDWDCTIRGRPGATASPLPASPSRPPSQRFGRSPIPRCVKPPPVSQHGFTPLTSSAAAHVAASPGLNSDGVQSSNDTPPHTPPTLKSSGGVATAATPGSLAGQFGGVNGLHNGYSQ